MTEDNRRRIKPELLDEIEDYEGDTFTEQLLNWNRKQDNVSTQVDDAIERFKEKIDNIDNQDNVSKSYSPDLDDIRNVMESVLKENLSRDALDSY